MRRPAFAALCAACALVVGIPGLLRLASAADSEAGPPVVRRTTDVALPVDDVTLERQYRALSSMSSVEVVYSALGPVRTVRGATGVELSRSTRDLKEGREAPEVLQKFKDVLLAAGSETLKVRLNRLSAIGRTIRMDQFIGGVPVLYGSVSVGIDDATGLVNVLGATFLPDRVTEEITADREQFQVRPGQRAALICEQERAVCVRPRAHPVSHTATFQRACHDTAVDFLIYIALIQIRHAAWLPGSTDGL